MKREEKPPENHYKFSKISCHTWRSKVEMLVGRVQNPQFNNITNGIFVLQECYTA
jgi:hypothetical protein